MTDGFDFRALNRDKHLNDRLKSGIKFMSCANENSFRAIQLFEPEPNVIYSIEVTERITHVPRRMIAVYCKHGLISPVGNPNSEGFYFDGIGIKILRRLESMRAAYGKNLADIKMILSFLNEIEKLRAETYFLRIHKNRF
ncbi:MAG TPA: MerR family transcriptional regulator [Verrucomicrobiae bacterium]|nr:MerR family transcriptional regulator [Verrucomicrobiae bacterium]